MQDASKPYAIIFEDDVILRPKFNENIDEIIDMINEYVRDVNEDFDIANLYTHPIHKHLFLREVRPRIIKAMTGLCGLQCYLVKRTTVHNLLNRLQHYENPVDEQLSRCGLRYIHLVGKDVVESEEIPSYIQCSRLKYTSVP
jgi:GR25 family glycosyltransferase involved in LPS biosynthesis